METREQPAISDPTTRGDRGARSDATAAGTRSSRTARTVRRLVAVAVALIVVMLAWLGLQVLHYTTTPDFAAYVRDHPVAEDTIAAQLADAPVLTEGREWRTGAVDPFAADEADGRVAWSVEQTATVHRGDDVLGRVVVEIVVSSPDGVQRDGLGIRIRELESADGLRAIARVALNDPDGVVGADSARKGCVTVDLLVVAGAGEDRASIVHAAPATPLPGDDGHVPSTLGLVASRAWPLRSPPDSGWIAHVRDRVFLSAQRLDGGEQGMGTGSASFAASTDEVQLRLRDQDPLELRTRRRVHEHRDPQERADLERQALVSRRATPRPAS